MLALLTTEEVAGILRVSARTVQRLVRARRIPVVTGCGKYWKFRPESIEQFVKDTETLALKPTKPIRVARKLPIVAPAKLD